MDNSGGGRRGLQRYVPRQIYRCGHRLFCSSWLQLEDLKSEFRIQGFNFSQDSLSFVGRHRAAVAAEARAGLAVQMVLATRYASALPFQGATQSMPVPSCASGRQGGSIVCVACDRSVALVERLTSGLIGQVLG